MPGFGTMQAARRLQHALRALPQALQPIDPGGWSASPASLTDLSMSPLTVVRNGFDASGAPSSLTDQVLLTRRVRRPYPDSSVSAGIVDSADRQALSDYVYAGDQVPGYVNNSAVISPKPHAAWIMPSRLLVGTTVHWEIIAFHRNAREARQVACVQVRGNDGTSQTAWQTVSAPAVSTLCEDANPVEAFIGDIDVTGLADGLIWLEARVLPWCGGTGSIRTTDDDASIRGFSPRYFLKSVAKAEAVPLAYVASTGNDANGVWSANPATASAAPFLTIAGALNAIYTTGASVTGGKADGCEIRVGNGTFALPAISTAQGRAQTAAALTITRSPTSSSRAAVVLTHGTVRFQLGRDGALASPLTESAVILKDVTVQRASTGSFNGTTNADASVTPLFIQWWNVALDVQGRTTTWFANTHDAMFGVTFSNFGTYNGNVGYVGTMQRRLLRGVVTGDMAGAAYDHYLVVGSTLTSGYSNALLPDDGTIFYASKVLKAGGNNNTPLRIEASGDGVTINRIAVVNALIEQIGTSTGNGGVVICGTAGNTLGAVLHHVTCTGAQNIGRCNLFYDNQDSSAGGAQTHDLTSVKGCLFAQVNIKGDIFRSDAAGVGNFAAMHGVGWEGLYTLYAANAPIQEHPTYAGPGSTIGTTSTVYGADPRFTDYRATSAIGGVVAAGAGGGDYRLQADSPCRAASVATVVLGRDLAGAFRGTSAQPTGCYV
jgi:hypothetical protein